MASRLCCTDRAIKLLVGIISAMALFHSCDGSLTVKPINVEAVVGQRVQLNCSTSESYYVLWDLASAGSTSRNYVFFSGVLVLPYSRRFQMNRDDATGVYNLVIPSVQKEDAGNYRCMDMVGHGEQAEAELIVLDSSPQCETAVIRFCDRTSHEFETSCTLGFRGNIVPEIQCSSNDVVTTNSVVNGQTENSVKYSLQLTAHWPLGDDHRIACRTSISNVSSSVKPTVNYAFGLTETLTHDPRSVVHCKANSSEQCSYKWINSNTSAVISSSHTLTAEEAGHYKCEATCNLQGEVCLVIPLVVQLSTQEDTHRSSATTAQNDSTTKYMYIVVGVSLSIVLIVAGILMTVYCTRRYRRHRSEDKEARKPCFGITLATSSTASSEGTSSDDILLPKTQNGDATNKH